MKRTTYQVPELRDENDNIIQQGAFGKNTALANSTNDGWIDYVANDLEALYNNTMGGTGGEINTETITGKTGTIANLTATTVKAGTVTADALNGPLTGNVTGTADKAVADGDGNNIVNTYVTKSAVQGELTNYLPLSGGTLTGVVNGVTPTAGDNSTKIATTEFVNAKAGNYLPLSGGTMTGVLTNNGSTSIPINIKTTGTDYRDIQIESSDGNHRIAAIRASKTSEGRCEITIGASTTSNAAPTGITISRSTTNIYATAPTPDATDNSTKIATTAWVQKLLADALKKAKLDAHPVGSYYWSNDSTSPATLFGGTWEALPAGYTLIAQGSGSDSFGSFTYTAGQKYGERKHQLTTDEMAPHTHESPDNAAGYFAGWGSKSGDGWVTQSAKRIDGANWETKSTGGGQAHNNLPPVIASYAWRRTA